MKYRVIYREPGDQTSKQIVMASSGEAFLRAECEAKGWQVLLIKVEEGGGVPYCLYAAAPYMRGRRRCWWWCWGLVLLVFLTLSIGAWAIYRLD